MSFLDDVMDFLSDNTAWVQATNLLESEMPDDPDTLIVVYENPGGPPNLIGSTRTPNLQIMARGEPGGGRSTPRAALEEIYLLLSKIGDPFQTDYPEGIEINGTQYNKFEAIQEPFSVGPKDEQGRHKVSVNFSVNYFRS